MAEGLRFRVAATGLRLQRGSRIEKHTHTHTHTHTHAHTHTHTRTNTRTNTRTKTHAHTHTHRDRAGFTDRPERVYGHRACRAYRFKLWGFSRL